MDLHVEVSVLRIVLKLYASLSVFLPSTAEDHAVALKVCAEDTPNRILEHHRVLKE